MWFEIRCLYEKENNKGDLKQIMEQYLYNGECVSDCEHRMLEEIPECEVTSVCRSKIMEIVNEGVNEGHFYKAKITETTVNDDGSESSRSYQVLGNAENLPSATKLFEEYLKSGLENMTLDAVTKTKIVDIL